MAKISKKKEKKQELSLETDLLGLAHEFSLDELDNWTTTTGLIQSVVNFAQQAIAGSEVHVFYHETGLHEYREIDREGITTIPDDSLFVGCLSMISDPMLVSQYFSDFQIDDPLLEPVLQNVYHAHTIMPVVHRFEMLAFILVCKENITEPLSAQEIHILKEITERLHINLYAASIADMRLRELLRMTQYPLGLQKRKSLKDVFENILSDIENEIPFDVGICYSYDSDTKDYLLPFSYKGLKNPPEPLALGKGISGLVFENRQPLYVPDRFTHPSYAIMPEEPFIDGSFISVPIATDKEFFGVITLVRAKENAHAFGVEHRYMLQIAAAFTASEIVSRQLYDRLSESNFSVVESLTRALEAKDAYTEGHSARVTKYAEGIARELGYKDERILQLRYGAMLHDIGKIGIPDAIINKTERLTDGEYAEIKQHTEIGYNILRNNPFFKNVRNFVRYHHETLIGTGYYGKKEGEIPEEAMIISAADIFDALTSDRPYRKALSMEVAIEELKKQTNVHYTQRIFDAFLRYIEKGNPLST